MVVSILGVTLLENVLGKTDVVNGRLLLWKDIGCCPKRSILVDVLCDSSILNLLAKYYHYCDIAYSWASCLFTICRFEVFFPDQPDAVRKSCLLSKSGMNDPGLSSLAMTTNSDNRWGEVCAHKAGSRSPSSGFSSSELNMKRWASNDFF